MAAEQKIAPKTATASQQSSHGAETSDQSPGPHADRLAGLDARAQSALLEQAFASPGVVKSETTIPSPRREGPIYRYGWRALKSLLGLAIVVVAGVGPAQRLFEFSSTEATVNSRLISLRAPIDGRIEDLTSTIGTSVPRGRFVLGISNSRADRSRLDDLQRLLDQTEGERPGVAKRLLRLKEIHAQITQQARAFQAGRIRELEERTLDLKAQISATEASVSETTSTLARTRALAASGNQTVVAVERAERDATISTQTQKSLHHRLSATEIELEAARRGEYVGDSYNDRPSSLQHADELSVRLAEIEAELSFRDERLARLRAAVVAETARYSEMSNAVLASPIDGQVWEILVSPSEEVRKGQDLVRFLDCSGTIVTATVRESVFNQLRIGDQALFRPAGETARYGGTIIRMSGSAAPPDNLAIQATGPASGGYRIAVSVPELASAHCNVGRTGAVVFSSNAGGVMRSLREAISFFAPGS